MCFHEGDQEGDQEDNQEGNRLADRHRLTLTDADSRIFEQTPAD